MSNLQILEWNFNSISTIEDNSFQDLINLQQLDLSFNRLNKTTSNIFNGSANLVWLTLNANRFETFERNSFIGLFGLQTLNFSFLQTLTQLKSGAFNGLANLNKLNFLEQFRQLLQTLLKDWGILISLIWGQIILPLSQTTRLFI